MPAPERIAFPSLVLVNHSIVVLLSFAVFTVGITLVVVGLADDNGKIVECELNFVGEAILCEGEICDVRCLLLVYNILACNVGLIVSNSNF